ncbi:tellurite resistance/C4-dicarboxylate transporter family protein [Mycobacterium fragae]|uniref:tellurite resistance/C4-dicarboxylate transporter family protein n=1 Tax=Mycobacterium fragae TaxID=1260918 RepID=UPI000A153FE2|nr:tellurite resistance/C4-dicarboxylate transporter family protein [Mycobacterium fragae]MCV7399326.1 tellurite resistance/C4-dicarboxylate transporter family protein [Mycobacterium fragae]
MTVQLNKSKLSPDVFAVVMATGILSVAARNHHYTWLSASLSLFTALALVVLVAATVIVAAAKGRVVPWSMTDAEVTLPLFTFVASCAVLANRLSSSYPMAVPILGATAALAWLILLVLSLRNLWGRRLAELRSQAHGAWLLVSVATSGLAIVAAKLTNNMGQRRWLIAALAFWGLALALYVMLTSLMVWRAVAERLDRDGFEPDAWILMGSLSIAVVAGHYIAEQAQNGLTGTMRVVTVVLWALASAWIPLLMYFSLHRIEQRPKILDFTGAWWTLVFPLGMYSAATYAIATELHTQPLQTVALVGFWNALMAWVIVAVSAVLRIPRAVNAITTDGTHEPRHSSTEPGGRSPERGPADASGGDRVRRLGSGQE